MTQIVVPAYGAAEQLRECLRSLHRHLPEDVEVFVVDDATPDDSVRLVCDEFHDFRALKYVRSDRNRGFVISCNWACKHLRSDDSDLLLLNSDAEVTPGFLSEMQYVLRFHEKHGVVTPRSNSATIFSVPPLDFYDFSPQESFEIWKNLYSSLPRFHVMPTAVGFCMLIKAEVLNRFQLFDEAYGLGYNEENDFVCRINRCGYSALSANWAFVFHHESSSFGSRKLQLEKTNRRRLLTRYPEYQRKVTDYLDYQLDPVEYFAGLHRRHKPRLLFDVFNLHPSYNGTAEFATNLLRELNLLLSDVCDIYLGIGREAMKFFRAELTGYRVYHDEPEFPMVFDLVFKPSQIFSWPDFRRMNRLAPRLSFTLLDIIAVRCAYLNSAGQQSVVEKSTELADLVFTISHFSSSDYRAFYERSKAQPKVVHLGTNLRWMTSGREGDYILVIGNHFAHKCLSEAVQAIGSDWPVVVLGNAPGSDNWGSHVRRLESGLLSRHDLQKLFKDARAIVYPSLYEGFGLPVLDAMALGKPTIVMDCEVNRELAGLASTNALIPIKTFSELPAALRRLDTKFSTGDTIPSEIRTWKVAGEAYADSLAELLTQAINLDKLQTRWDVVRTVYSANHS